MRWLVLGLGLALGLVACQSSAVAPQVAAVPSSLADALAQANVELEQGRWETAWSLVSNRTEDSDEKQLFLARVVESLKSWLRDAASDVDPRRLLDWQASLSLIQTGSWEPPSVVESSADSSPAQWLKGTATVVVNKGLRVENGSAQPDIVIGSGFFVSADGLLLTNHHVIASEVEPSKSTSSKLSIRLPGSKGERLPARVLGWDANLDLALLKVEYKPEFVFHLANGSDPVPGQRLQALGSPGGLEATLTEGIVSSVARPLLAVGEVLQIDAAVNPGNSGGPLLDAKGAVVGVVFAGIRDFQGVNFAIPASLVRLVLPRLQAGGRAVLPWIGLGLQEDHRGLEVLYVVPRSPADWAGLRKGDRLVGVAGHAVNEVAEAQVRLLAFGTDAVVPLDVLRADQPLRVWSTLERRPDYPLKEAAVSDLAARVLPLAFGVEVEDTAAGVDKSFRVTRVWPGSAAEDLSLAENDPLEVLDWVADLDKKVLTTTWKVKRRLGGYLESVVQMSIPFTSRQFL